MPVPEKNWSDHRAGIIGFNSASDVLVLIKKGLNKAQINYTERSGLLPVQFC